jgi:hypothetical protein
MKISIEEMFPEAFKEVRAREEANRPDTRWFACLPPDKIDAYMSKYPFKSFDEIPKDNCGLQYPSFERIDFYLPSWVAAQKHLPENRRKETVITTIDGFSLLRNLGVQAFNIDARRWHKIKKYISKGKVELPQMSDDCERIVDGRHRTLLIMQIYNMPEVPVFYTRKVSRQMG